MKKLCILSIFLTLLSCGKAEDKGKDVALWSFFSGGDGGFMTDLVNKFNAENSEYAVNDLTIEWNSFYPKLITGFVSGEVPDIASAHAEALLNIISNGGDLWNIDEIPGANVDWNNFPEGIVKSVTVDGKKVAFPLDVHGMVLFINKKYVEKAPFMSADGNTLKVSGITEFTNALEWIKSNNPGVTPLYFNSPDVQDVYLWYTFYRQMGGGSLFNKAGKFEINDKLALESLKLLRDLLNKGYTQFGARDEYAIFKDEQKAALMIAGVWLFGGLQQDKEAGKLDFSVQTMPSFFNNSVVTYGDNHVFVIPKSVSPEKAAKALKFAQFLGNNSAHWALAGHIPTSLAVRKSPEYNALPNSVYQGLADNYVSYGQSPNILHTRDVISREFSLYLSTPSQTPEMTLSNIKRDLQ